MDFIKITDRTFWDWMKFQPQKGFSQYIESIAELMPSHGDGHVAYAYHQNYQKALQLTKDPKGFILDLREIVPKWYYEEILFSAQAYSILFGMLFPRIVDHVEELTYIEWLLYTEPESRKYRDHLVHMFKVAYVCHNFSKQKTFFKKTENLQTKSKHFNKWLRESSLQNYINTNNLQCLIKIALFIASVFHDFGYGYFFMNLYKKRLHNINAWLLPGADPTCCNLDTTQKLLKSLPGEFIRTYHYSSTNNLRSERSKDISEQNVASFFYNNRLINHSVASTFFIIDLCERLYELEAISGPLYIAFQLAAEICMIHDMTGPNKWMDLRSAPNLHFINKKIQKQIPLSMVFILADELAVWNRARLDFKHFGNDSIKQTIKKKPDENIEIKLSYSPLQLLINASKETRSNIKAAIEELAFLKDTAIKQKILGFEIIIQ